MEQEEATPADISFEEREEIMVSVSSAHQKHQALRKRKARFLKPSLASSSMAKSVISPLSVPISMEEEEEEEAADIIFEEREEIMVSVSSAHQKHQALRKRKARFLKPSLTSSSMAESVISPLSVSCSSASLLPTDFEPKKWPLRFNINGWPYRIPLWVSWVENLHDKYQLLWKDAGIYESILSSTHRIRKHPDLIIGFAEKWCPDTNTFIFPWGETTITLEDILILGGFSVIGCPVTCVSSCCVLPSPHLREIKNRLKQETSKLMTGTFCLENWIGNCMGSEIEHEAFLFLWLSKFVLNTDNHGIIQPHLFRIAILLARGKRIAFAPAVLSCIYRDLSLLKLSVLASATVYPINCLRKRKRKLGITLNSPLRLVQLWVWERFSAFQPSPNSIKLGDPRAARWCKVGKPKIQNVRLALDTVAAEGFVWCPYVVEIGGWQVPEFYKSKEELRWFCICMRASELVAFDCIQQYLPHRVALQFGMDQDVPANVIRHNKSPEIAWRHYMRPICDKHIYLPSRTNFEPGLTLRYSKWWKNEDLTENVYVRRKRCLMNKMKIVPRIQFFRQQLLQEEATKETDDIVDIPVIYAADLNEKVAEFRAKCCSNAQLLDIVPFNDKTRKFCDKSSACFPSKKLIGADIPQSLTSTEVKVCNVHPSAEEDNGNLEAATENERDDAAVNVADSNKKGWVADCRAKCGSIAQTSDIAPANDNVRKVCDDTECFPTEVDIPPSSVEKSIEVQAEVSRLLVDDDMLEVQISCMKADNSAARELMVDKQVESSDFSDHVVVISDDSAMQAKCDSTSESYESPNDKTGSENVIDAGVGCIPTEDKVFADVGSTHLEDDPLDVLDLHESLKKPDVRAKEIPVYEILDSDDEDDKDYNKKDTELRERLARLQEKIARYAATKSGKKCDQNPKEEIIIIDDD